MHDLMKGITEIINALTGLTKEIIAGLGLVLAILKFRSVRKNKRPVSPHRSKSR